MSLVRPPEWVVLEQLITLEFCSDSPTLVISKSMTVFLEKCIYTRDTAVPTVFQIFQRQSSILNISFLAFHRIFSPDPLGVHKLGFPRLDVTVQIRDGLVFIMRHTGPEMCDSGLSLLGPSQITLWDQYMTH